MSPGVPSVLFRVVISRCFSTAEIRSRFLPGRIPAGWIASPSCAGSSTASANAFFRIPVSEFCDRKVTAGEAGDRDLLELEDRLLYEAEDRNCIRLVEQFLLRRLNPLKSYNLERMRSVISTIDREKGEIRVSDLASSVFLSTKQFQRVFTGHIGISPKDFLRIVRFQHALYMLQSVPGMTFSRLACECGFYDQPHLISEFKIFSGYTPKEYLSLCAPYSDYFSTEND